MSLGVLNNLSAVYAENAVSNTNSNLQNVLQQLSTGSRINSGADDAAGLSLVDGLQANQQALNQSQTNASEGVGLLQVADGALSQVTSLLNRAVTLATEASNGTLNTSQDAAANQEYQSILSEIDNIGSTTTYNQETVFGHSFDIYTGDSTAQGASVNDLDLTGLSSSSVGSTGGAMSYSSGDNVFIDLTAAGAGSNAQSTDTITGGLTVNYVDAAGNDGTLTITPTTDTVGGLINAINNSGLGLTASFATASQAGANAVGAAGAATTDTGIMITGAIGTAAASATMMQVTSTAEDTSSGQAAAAVTTADSSGVATIGYTASGGQSLTGTDLSNSSDAQTALTDLNAAIADVAAQDGYVGAQINTLNSVSNVLSTQSENVQSAQNAVQATDYAQATSNMSKYEILSQTGIAALAQANSMQQDVLKLLQ